MLSAVIASLATKQEAVAIKPYSTKDIMLTVPHLHGFHPRLLVFNGTQFEVYNLNHKDSWYLDIWQCGRCTTIVPVLANALKTWNPGRFEAGQPPFQLLFSDGDSISTACVNKEEKCPVKDFAPILLFGSAPADESELPTVKGFPNWFYLKCIYDYRMNGKDHCEWAEEAVDPAIMWRDLQSTIIWRGSDFCFLHDYKQFMRHTETRSINWTNVATKEGGTTKLLDQWEQLNPRWRGVALSAQAELSNTTTKWIDAKFTGPFNADVHKKFLDLGVVVSTAQKMKPTDMARYKYQIDFGGGGGTSWRGTLTKLGFPGVLFHHNTLTKDWFFDEMKPWHHYIPVGLHISDLWTQYKWAERHQEEAMKISGQATRLYDTFMQAPYMDRVYNELFVDYLGTVAEAQIDSPPSTTWPTIKQQYETSGFMLRQVSYCDDESCYMAANRGVDSSANLVISRKYSMR